MMTTDERKTADSSGNSNEAPPTNITIAKRRRFTNAERMAMVRIVKRRIAEGQSIRCVCKSLNIIPKQYREWAANSTFLIKEHSNVGAKSIHKGRVSILEPIESDLLMYIFELREQGFPVSVSNVIIKARSLMGSSFEQAAVIQGKRSSCSKVDQTTSTCTQDGHT